MVRYTLIVPSLLFGLVSGHADASALQVSPVTLDVTAPARTASVNLRNESSDPTNVQIRIYRWTQNGGRDQLTPATDAVVSPPAITVQPGKTYTIRVAQLSGVAKSGEESYRMLIDELPNINVRRRRTVVDLVTRYSVPVFFSDRSASTALSWSVRREGRNLDIAATNHGNRHAKVANLSVATTGSLVKFGDGLNGYVLPGSTMHWSASAGPVKTGSRVTIKAKGDDYAVNEAAVVSGH